MTNTIPALSDLGSMDAAQLDAAERQIATRLVDLHYDSRGDMRELEGEERDEFDRLIHLTDRVRAHRAVRETYNRGRGRVSRAFDTRDDNRYAGLDGAMSAGLRSLDRLGDRLPPDRQDAMERAIRASSPFAAEFAVLSTEEYQEAFRKILLHGEGRAHLAMSEEERGAMVDAMHASEVRALAEGTPSAGGYAVPTALDPSIIMTAQGSGNPMLNLGRVVDVAGSNVWKGVSSAGVSWSFDAEASEVSDDSPELAQPQVDIHMARGFIPYSIEISEDFSGFAGEMARLLDEGYSELLAQKLAVGSGTGEPKGILTALSSNTNVRVRVTTSGTLGEVDLYRVWAALPERFRNRANWVMSVGVNNTVRRLGTANLYHAYTVALPAGAADELMTKSVHLSSYFADTTSGTGNLNWLAVGDWSNYVVARRSGMRVELVQHLVGLTSNRPTGQRGLFAWARIGGNSANDLGFRLLTNTT